MMMPRPCSDWNPTNARNSPMPPVVASERERGKSFIRNQCAGVKEARTKTIPSSKIAAMIALYVTCIDNSNSTLTCILQIDQSCNRAQLELCQSLDAQIECKCVQYHTIIRKHTTEVSLVIQVMVQHGRGCFAFSTCLPHQCHIDQPRSLGMS